MRKAYGAGLYAMAGPGFGPDATLALPTARIAVMGPEAAVNAVYANKINEIADPDEREQFVQDRRREYEEDVDLERLVADLVLDGIIEADAAARRAAPPPALRRAARPQLQHPPPGDPAGLGPEHHDMPALALRTRRTRRGKEPVSGATWQREPLCRTTGSGRGRRHGTCAAAQAVETPPDPC